MGWKQFSWKYLHNNKCSRAVSESKNVWLSWPVIVRIKGRNPNARLMHGLTIKPAEFAVEKYLVVFDVKIEILSGLFFCMLLWECKRKTIMQSAENFSSRFLKEINYS